MNSTQNMTFKDFWTAKGKNDARNARVANANFSALHRKKYSFAELALAEVYYSMGYDDALAAMDAEDAARNLY